MVAWYLLERCSPSLTSETTCCLLVSSHHCAGVKPSSQGTRAKGASLSDRIKLFEQQAAAAAATGSSRAPLGANAATAKAAVTSGSSHQGGSGSGPHRNCIISICPLPSATPGTLVFLTASLEGCLAEWQVDPASL